MSREDAIAAMNDARTQLGNDMTETLFEWLDNACCIIDECIAEAARAGHGSLHVMIDRMPAGSYVYNDGSDTVYVGFTGVFDSSWYEPLQGALADLIGEIYENEYTIPVHKAQRSWKDVLLFHPAETYRYEWNSGLDWRGNWVNIPYVTIQWA